MIAEIDGIAGEGRRTAYLVELATREVKLERQRAALRAAEGAWKAEDHPELERGSVEFVRGLRDLDRARWLDLAETDGGMK